MVDHDAARIADRFADVRGRLRFLLWLIAGQKWRVAVMDAGLVTELGTREELVALGGAYANLRRSWHGD